MCVSVRVYVCAYVCEWVRVCVWTALAPGFCQEGVSAECYLFFFPSALKKQQGIKGSTKKCFLRLNDKKLTRCIKMGLIGMAGDAGYTESPC